MRKLSPRWRFFRSGVLIGPALSASGSAACGNTLFSALTASGAGRVHSTQSPGSSWNAAYPSASPPANEVRCLGEHVSLPRASPAGSVERVSGRTGWELSSPRRVRRVVLTSKALRSWLLLPTWSRTGRNQDCPSASVSRQHTETRSRQVLRRPSGENPDPQVSRVRVGGMGLVFERLVGRQDGQVGQAHPIPVGEVFSSLDRVTHARDAGPGE